MTAERSRPGRYDIEKAIEVAETVAEGDLEMWFIPDIPGKEFRWKVESGAEAEKLVEVLAAYNRYLHRRGLMDDYEADASGVEIFEDGEWTEFYLAGEES